ncbi:hypothetical protein [Streptomyces sp. NPDC002676]
MDTVLRVEPSDGLGDTPARQTWRDLLSRWLDRTPHVECIHDLFAEDTGGTTDQAGE